MIRSKALGVRLAPASELSEVDILAEMMLDFPVNYSVRLARLDAATCIDFNEVVGEPGRIDRQTLLAFSEETIVGFVQLKWNSSHADVLHLAVHPDHQGQGYLDKIVKLLRPYVFEHLNMETCSFDVLDQSEPLKGYCERRDLFTQTWTRKSDNGDHDLHRQIVSKEGYLKCLEEEHEQVPDLEMPE